MELHTYKICKLLPRDADQKMGRPPREVLMSWDDLKDDEVAPMRKLQEPRLRPGQIAELDGKIVARGPEAIEAAVPTAEEQDDADDADDADDLDDADEQHVAPNLGDPVAVTKHATRILRDAYRWHRDASSELREQTNELNRRAIAQAKQLDEVLSAMHNRQSSPPFSISVDEIRDLLRIGARMFKGGSEQDPEQEE